MFFADKLGPALTQFDGQQISQRVEARRKGRNNLSLEEMREIVAGYLRERGIKANVDAVIAQLNQSGHALLSY
ncbi:MAG: hypothetical protein KF700_07615 [Hyphomonadaceae bacterium]|nr:hypothetical protein [Hyphomonadaceae bacterium]